MSAGSHLESRAIPPSGIRTNHRRGSEDSTVPIYLFFDVGSLYSFLTFTILSRYGRGPWRRRVRLFLRPVLLGGVFKAVGNEAPIARPYFRQYLRKDSQRMAQWVLGRAVQEAFPSSTLHAMRLVTACQLHRPDLLEDVIRSLFAGHWLKGLDITKEDGLLNVLTAEVPISDAEARLLLSQSQDSPTKLALKELTEHFVQLGGFGVPALVCPSRNSATFEMQASPSFDEPSLLVRPTLPTQQEMAKEEKPTHAFVIDEALTRGDGNGHTESSGQDNRFLPWKSRDDPFELFFGTDRIFLLAHRNSLPYWGSLKQLSYDLGGEYESKGPSAATTSKL